VAHYSFYGNSITKPAQALIDDGVKLCLCKCPDSKPLHSEWHEQNKRQNGIDFRWIYQTRAEWWFCDTFIPDDERFMEKFDLLGGHIPTTGFAAILDVLSWQPKSVYLTGFDFFASKIHNVDERWNPGDSSDPIGHDNDAERRWISDNRKASNITCDIEMMKLIGQRDSVSGGWV
jgi:hypothetical protein